MRALVIRGGTVTVTERPAPEPGPDDALIRVALAGVCGTDLELLSGYKAGFDGVPGHEFVGVVERCDGAPELVGKRVVGELNVGCGTCVICARAGPGHCPARRVLGVIGIDGAMAELVVLPAANLHVVPDCVSDVQAVFVEPLAAACRIQEQVEVGADLRVVVVGAGRLGALCALVLQRTGAQVEAVARNARVRVLLDAAGVRTVAEAADVRAGADLVVDATGSSGGLAVARALVRPRGTLVLKSTCAGSDTGALDPTSLVVDEITVVGSRCGPFERALELLADGMIQTEPFVDDVLPLSEGPHAFELASRSGALKILLSPER